MFDFFLKPIVAEMPCNSLDCILGDFTKTTKKLEVFLNGANEDKTFYEERLSEVTADIEAGTKVLTNINQLLGK